MMSNEQIARGSVLSIIAELDRRDAEIERLREAVKFLNSFRPDAELAKRAAEIERLRHEVTLREQICADATLYARRLQEADDEVERLRELLRPFAALPVNDLGQCQRHPDEPVFAINGVSFTATDVLRARKALGE